MTIIKLQPAAYIDNIYEGGYVGTKLPYPFFVNEDGNVGRQDFWRGAIVRVIGFQRDLAKMQIDVRWVEAIDDLSKVIGMYLVTSDENATYGVHQTAIIEAEVLTEGEAK